MRLRSVPVSSCESALASSVLPARTSEDVSRASRASERGCGMARAARRRSRRTRARRAEEEERGDRPVARVEPGARETDGRRNGLDGGLLALDALAQDRLEVDEAREVAAEEGRRRDARCLRALGRCVSIGSYGTSKSQEEERDAPWRRRAQCRRS